MSENLALIQKRTEFKERLTSREYSTLAGTILDGASYLLQRIMRRQKPLSDWYIGLVLALLTLSTTYVISILSGDDYSIAGVQSQLWGMFISILALLGVKKSISMLMKTLHDSVVDSMRSVEDLIDLQHWLGGVLNKKRQFKATLLIMLLSVLIAIGPSILLFFIGQDRILIGPTIFLILLLIPLAIGLYNLLIIFPLTTRLRRYQYDLFAIDPASSQMIAALSGAFNNLLYIVSIFSALLTIGFTLFPATEALMILFNLGMIVVILWGPLVILFANNQYTLSRIIRRTKRQTLNELQWQIEGLYKQASLPDEKTLEYLNKLMDYHSRIKKTQNSAFDFRAGLSFLNSLILPLLAFLLANFDKIIDWLS